MACFMVAFVPIQASARQRSLTQFESNLFTQMETEFLAFQNPNASLVGFEPVAENEHLELFVRPNSLAIKVRNKETGYIWSSTVDSKEYHQLNNTWQDFIASAVTIDFANPNGNVTRENILTNQSAVTFQANENGFAAEITFAAAQISLRLEVFLDGHSVVVNIPQESVQELGENRLMTLHAYPFLGATFEDEVPGYMFIPDGSGALIRFDQQRVTMDSPFVAPIFGENLGVSSPQVSEVNAPFNALVPVFGMVHGVNQNGFLAIIENGENYANIVAQTAGLQTEFNWITAQFSYRYAFRQPTTQDETRGPTIDRIQEEMNNFDATIRFQFLSEESANYVGMALAFQEYLIGTGVLSPLEQSGPSLRLEFIGAEIEEGLLWNRVIAMTPIDSLPDYASRLREQGISDMLMVYRNWSRGGSQAMPNRFPFERRLGNRGTVNSITETLASENIPLFFHTDYTRSFNSGNRLFGQNTDLVQQINTRTVTVMENNQSFNLIAPLAALNQAKRDLNNFDQYGMIHLAVDGIASKAFSSFNREAEKSRAQNQETSLELLAQLNRGNTSRTALYAPNAFAWGMTNYFFDIPMTSSRHLFVTDSVPFLQIVLSGFISLYAPVSNFSANQRLDLLRMIDFGVYPSFLLTSEPSHLLAGTPSRHIFTSEFDVWESEIVNQYQTVQEALSLVAGERITNRLILAPGVVQIDYANGVSIFVNYTTHPFHFEGGTIEAENFLVREVR